MHQPSNFLSRSFSWISYFSGWLVINVSLALFFAALASHTLAGEAVLIVTGFVALWWGGFFIHRKFRSVPYGAFLWTMPFMILMGILGAQPFLLPFKQPVFLDSPDEITGYPNQRAWLIAHAVPRAEYFGFAESSRMSMVHFRGAAPVVAEDWEPTQPISLWAVCHAAFYHSQRSDWPVHVSETCVPSWNASRPISVVGVSMDEEAVYGGIIGQIEESHGLKSAPDAVIAEVGVDLDREAGFYEKFALISLAVAQLGWLLGYPLVQLIRRYRKSQQ